MLFFTYHKKHYTHSWTLLMYYFAQFQGVISNGIEEWGVTSEIKLEKQAVMTIFFSQDSHIGLYYYI